MRYLPGYFKISKRSNVFINRKINYPKYYFFKLTGCPRENSETLVWHDFTFHCHYNTEENTNNWQKLTMK